MPSLDAIFKAYDVRGTVPDQLDPELAHAIGVGFAAFAREEAEGRGESVTRVLMARDMRPSGVELSAAFADGVRSQGLDVVDLGLGSTDLLYFASGSMGAPGVMFTASHNPAQYNGAKFCLSGARPVGEDTGLGRIREVGEASLAGSVPAAATTGSISSLDLLGAFADHVRSFVDVSSLAPLRIVADTANGMGGLIVPAVFSSLPFQLEVMYGELDGTFPVTLDADGNFTLELSLMASRHGSDADGRTYVISLYAVDNEGNEADPDTATVTVPHDQRRAPAPE